MEMTRRACLDNPMFEASEFEIQLKGPSYTVNTLQAFATNSNADIFFILGTDSLREIHTWKDYEKLFSLAHFIVVTRPGIQFLDAWLEVPHVLRDRFRIERDHFVHAGSTVLVPSKVVGLNISSTQIRALLRQGRSIRYLVTDPVWSYIVENHLYGS
jgi:nicotinate-nucleotide adenylyltransferase